MFPGTLLCLCPTPLNLAEWWVIHPRQDFHTDIPETSGRGYKDYQINLSGRHHVTLWSPIVTHLNMRTSWICEQTHHDFLRCAFSPIPFFLRRCSTGLHSYMCDPVFVRAGWQMIHLHQHFSRTCPPSQRASGNARRSASWIICVSETVLDCMSFFFDSPKKQLDNFFCPLIQIP